VITQVCQLRMYDGGPRILWRLLPWGGRGDEGFAVEIGVQGWSSCQPMRQSRVEGAI